MTEKILRQSVATSPHIPLPDGLSDPRATAAAVFDRIADLYDRARPGYPARAVADLVRRCAITSSSRVLEIGCGTGQLTGDIARSGAHIVALEPGASLAALARTNLADHPNVEVVVTRFEELEEPTGSFDAVVAATSFHWIHPDLAYTKAASLLTNEGFLALMTHVQAAGGTHTADTFAAEVRQLHRRLAPQVGDRLFPPAEQIVQHATVGGDIAAVWARPDRKLAEQPDVSGLFAAPEVRTYPWLATYDRDGYLAWLASQSSYALLEPARRSELMEGIGRLVDDLLGGEVTKQYVTVLAIAERLGASGPGAGGLPDRDVEAVEHIRQRDLEQEG